MQRFHHVMYKNVKAVAMESDQNRVYLVHKAVLAAVFICNNLMRGEFPIKLSQQQVEFFNTFGFLKLTGMFKDDIDDITEAFERVLQAYQEKSTIHDGSKRTMVGGCVDSSARLSALLDDPRILGACSSLLGDDFIYWGSDGNYYSGDTGWHPDGQEENHLHIKVAFYLDPLDGTNGALRVIPGSHRMGEQYAKDIKRTVMNSEQYLGIHGSEVPAQVLDVIPGDVLIFDHRTFHSAWNGSTLRRMFTMNLCRQYPEDKLDELRSMIVNHVSSHITEYYGIQMRETADSERMKHLVTMLGLMDWDKQTKHLKEKIYISVD
ncbi:phytanoyl-CoA dioxygenase family protein [Paenibacillus nasutitermitis]|uniref:Phytanoyl-CoA dioxygenase family protein n=1 Tax=Paenibacillus nasutitermitis TaxID=1652958 RepID=A0A916Z7A9_9BACL|nr:phytanoyl-CoA dioxygenase family protein [Paenibacillus nasutitermitis]GGD80028.1 hypothetical protein GCM10010911_42660 [Paenibacillus nasutitermitis]